MGLDDTLHVGCIVGTNMCVEDRIGIDLSRNTKLARFPPVGK